MNPCRARRMNLAAQDLTPVAGSSVPLVWRLADGSDKCAVRALRMSSPT